MLLGARDARIEGLGFQESPKASNCERNMSMNLAQAVWGQSLGLGGLGYGPGRW